MLNRTGIVVLAGLAAAAVGFGAGSVLTGGDDASASKAASPAPKTATLSEVQVEPLDAVAGPSATVVVPSLAKAKRKTATKAKKASSSPGSVSAAPSTPTQATPATPAPSNPAPSNPAPSKPAPSKPTPSKPSPSKPSDDPTIIIG